MVRSTATLERNLGSTSKKTDVRQLLTDARNLGDFFDPKNAAQVDKFQDDHQDLLSGNVEAPAAGGHYQVLHILADQADAVNTFGSLLRWIAKERTQLLRSMESEANTALHQAIKSGKHSFVEFMLKNTVEKEHIFDPVTLRGENCLHLAIDSKSPSTKLLIEMASKLRQSFPERHREATTPTLRTSESQDLTKFQPEGYEARTSNPFKRETSLKGEPDNDGKETPLHFAMYSVDPSLASVPTDAIVSSGTNTPLSTSRTAGALQLQNALQKRSSFQVANGTESTSKLPDDKLEPSRNAPGVQRSKDLSLEVPEIVKLLIEACPGVLRDCRDEGGDTPFQARLSYVHMKLKIEPTSEHLMSAKGRHHIIQNDPIARYIRDYCLQHFERPEILAALYKPGTEPLIEFDLSGLPYPIDHKYMSGLQNVLKFEGVLKYVSLPRLEMSLEAGIDDSAADPNLHTSAVQASRRALLNGAAAQNNLQKEKKEEICAGSNNMCFIFKWLRDRSVDFVREVIVADDVEPSHSDEAIETCLQGLDVRVWNWQKADLCSEVIVRCAPKAEEVTLCSSGNNAVLVGWASPSGLPKLENLKSVHLLVRPGLEKPSRLHQYVEDFATDLNNNVKAVQKRNAVKDPPGIKFTKETLRSDQSFSSAYTEIRTKTATESPWMKCMKDFAEFLTTIKMEKKPDPIKIAVIDDGINLGIKAFAGRVVKGDSFHQLSSWQPMARGDYFVPSGPHGTLMAQLICLVCPMVKLYIAKLEEVGGREGRRSFTIESATKAIEWATRQDVDIISMSWSIDRNSEVQSLDAALQQAKNKHIILFGSSIDKGRTATDNTYPGKHCIKIGASTGNGTILSWVSKMSCDFLAPGEGVQPTDTHGWSQLSDPSGSSVSTALAAGLAGVLLYCDRLIGTEKQKVIGSPDVDILRFNDNMEAAFKFFAKEPDNFLQVYDYFPKKIGQFEWEFQARGSSESMVWNSKRDVERTDMTRQVIRDLMLLVKHKIGVTKPN